MAATAKPRNRVGWRLLGLCWLALLTLGSVGSGVLQWLGSREPAGHEAVLAPEASGGVPVPETRHASTEGKSASATGTPRPLTLGLTIRETAGAVAAPEEPLLEPIAEGSKVNLPRIASDGRIAMRVYAAGFDPGSRRPRIGLVLAGIGLNAAESESAIRTLPGAVSLGVSPYAKNMPPLLTAARAAGHEYLIALPLEPAGFPLNDPGPSTLLTSLSPSANVQSLHWALSRIDGYVGAIGVIGTMRGERLAAMVDQMDAVLSELHERGLLYVDPREDRGPVSKTWGRHVDILIDDPADRDVADRTMIDAKLTELEQLARDTGSALGLVMRPTPVTIARIAAWSNGLADRGLALAPASALVIPPAGAAVKLSERE
jgi:polysaccharide deacetylase 2 family uncharacterized protein YibQ